MAFKTTKTIHKRTEYRTCRPSKLNNILQIKYFVFHLTCIQDEKVYRLTRGTKTIFSLSDSKEMPVIMSSMKYRQNNKNYTKHTQ